MSRYPALNRFVVDWLAGDSRFLPRGDGASVWAPPARRRDHDSAAESAAATQNPNRDLTEALVRSNSRWGLAVRASVEAWASGEAVTLVAGQQVGFAGGPIYTIAKIASLVKMKRELEKAGRKATVFFWLATEDHDFAEIATLALPVANGQTDLVKLRLSRPPSFEMVGALPVPEPLVQELLALYPMARPAWLREGITFRDSFAELIASVFGNEIVLIDALLPELRRAGAPLFARIHESWSEVERCLEDRSRELAEAGYTPQIASRDGRYTLLFRIDPDGTRHALDAPAELEPERTSTSALTRPLLQDFVLRPDVFLGGPAEVAYYAQLAPLHQLLDIPLPRVALRGHALIAPKRVARALDRYQLDPEEVFRDADALLADREPENVAKIQSLADEARRDLFARIEQIGELALPADHAVARSISRSIGHIEYHFDKLAERSIRGMVRKDRERYAAVKEIVATLFPDRQVQDRVVSWLPFWLEHGKLLIDVMIDLIEPDTPNFRIIQL